MEEYIVRVYEDKMEWYKDNKLHRLDGPAIKCCNGTKCWYENGLLHRIDGPAIEGKGYKAWFKNGIRHRSNGPAFECDGREIQYWVEGKEYTEKEFLLNTLPIKEIILEKLSKILDK